ncbi:MAG TPA: hypothetical protein VMW65_05080 [Chloroflexota bacterium]|nr:hypothetical protein [Chloroflexota bacterium]
MSPIYHTLHLAQLLRLALPAALENEVNAGEVSERPGESRSRTWLIAAALLAVGAAWQIGASDRFIGIARKVITPGAGPAKGPRE